MKEITFISTSDPLNKYELAILFETKGGIALKYIGDLFNFKRKERFYEIIENHILAASPSDLFEVTEECLKALRKAGFKIKNERYPLFFTKEASGHYGYIAKK